MIVIRIAKIFHYFVIKKLQLYNYFITIYQIVYQLFGFKFAI